MLVLYGARTVIKILASKIKFGIWNKTWEMKNWQWKKLCWKTKQEFKICFILFFSDNGLNFYSWQFVCFKWLFILNRESFYAVTVFAVSILCHRFDMESRGLSGGGKDSVISTQALHNPTPCFSILLPVIIQLFVTVVNISFLGSGFFFYA